MIERLLMRNIWNDDNHNINNNMIKKSRSKDNMIIKRI
jgi:hypothetical protein